MQPTVIITEFGYAYNYALPKVLHAANITAFVTGTVKTGHVGTKYTLLLNKSYLVIGIEYLHSVILQSQINCKQTVKIF